MHALTKLDIGSSEKTNSYACFVSHSLLTGCDTTCGPHLRVAQRSSARAQAQVGAQEPAGSKAAADRDAEAGRDEPGAIESDPETLSKTMQVREAIAEGKTNAAMEALIECFGLDGPHALRAVSALRKMME